MTTNQKRSATRGSAMLVALGLGFVLMIIIAGVRTFSSYRVQNTVMESQMVRALAIAEAGISCVMTEMSNNYGFQTHSVKADQTWDTPQTYSPTLAAPTGVAFSVVNKTQGTYEGTLEGGQFKVRVGPIDKYLDDKRTKNIDESKCFIKVEAMGRIGDTVRRVDAIIKRRFPGREFLMYDGDFLSIVFGEPAVSNINKFSTGHLYGHNGIEIGQILLSRHSPCSPGSNQELYDMDNIICGNGGIFFYNPIKCQFRARPGFPELTVTMPKNEDKGSFVSGTYSSPDARQHGEYPEQIRTKTPELAASLDENTQKQIKERMKDKRSGVSIPPKPIPFDLHKDKATNGGLFIPASDGQNKDYAVPPGWGSSGSKVRARVLDFGNEIGSATGKLLHPANFTLPATFNGTIFAEENLVIRGNPPRTVRIVSLKNVFIAGDFNQRAEPSRKSDRYGLPQNYAQDALTNEDYEASTRDRLMDDKDPTKFQNHFPVEVISKERIVYDYRNPMDCFENEIYPFMKYKLASFLKDENTAKDAILKVAGTGGIQTSAADGPGVKNCIASYFQEFPLMTPADETAVADEFAKHRTDKGAMFSEAEFDVLCQLVWEKYRTNYEAKKLEVEDPGTAKVGKFGVYKLLNKLRAAMKSGSGITDQKDDYLFFPEITNNGMFIACGKRNQTFYAGPDYSKSYEHIGSSQNGVGPGLGIEHSQMIEMVHRMFGSEIRMALYDTPRVQFIYTPPTRRKLYDESLPTMGLNGGGGDLSSYHLISWKDSGALPPDFTAF